MLPRALAPLLSSFSALGLLLGTLFFAASLTPSLVPRPHLVQGVLGGLCAAAGYGIGAMIRALWRVLRLPEPGGRAMTAARRVAAVLCLCLAAAALWQASGWQTRLRALMDLPPVDGARPLTVALVAVAVFLLLWLVGRLFRGILSGIARRLGRRVPGPVAALVALVLTAALFWQIGNGVILAAAMRGLDGIYARLDAAFEEASPRPSDPRKTGGPGSLVAWEGLGRAGREVVAAPPDAARIAALTGGPAQDPLRVYVGLNSAGSVAERARLALDEAIRIGAFERSVLVIATPTGTGWLDPEGQQALEFLLRGDVATVSVQYSYLASWLALLADPDYGIETARAVFALIYDHWRGLPRDRRPKLYLHGLSLGSFNSDLSHDLFQVIGDPYDGAFWVGPPFPSRTWGAVTAGRNPGAPAWLPVVRDGAVVRFTAQENRLGDAAAPWGPYRVIYLQYASDAVTFFDPAALWRRPAWMAAPVGPDVSPDLIWVPVVTLLQLAIDLALATTTPLGHGHVYRFDHYLDGWAALTDAPGWTPEGLAALKAGFEAGRR